MTSFVRGGSSRGLSFSVSPVVCAPAVRLGKHKKANQNVGRPVSLAALPSCRPLSSLLAASMSPRGRLQSRLHAVAGIGLGPVATKK